MKDKLKKLSTFILSMVVMLGVFMKVAPVSAETTIDTSKKGSLTIYKLDSEGLDSIPTGASTNDYYQDSTGKYYKRLKDADYTIYRVGEINQTTVSGSSSTVQYKDIDGGAILDLSDLSALETLISGKLTSYTGITKTSTGSDGELEFSNLALGLYYVVETGMPSGYANPNNFFVQIPMTTTNTSDEQYWEYDVIAYPKNAVAGDIDKNIVEDTVTIDESGTEDKYTTSLGSMVAYTIDATTPADLVTYAYEADGVTINYTNSTLNYDSYVIVDKANKYLAVDTSKIEVYYYDATSTKVTLTSSDYAVTQVAHDAAGNTEGKNYTYITINNDVLKKIGNANKVYVDYVADVSTDVAAADIVVLENKAYIEYLPAGTTETLRTPEVEEIVFVYSYSAQKIEGKNNTPLAGAEFVIAQYLDGSGNVVDKNSGTLNYLTYNTNDGWGYTTNVANAYKVTSADDANASYNEGIFSFRGIKVGTYYLIETKAPTGYSLLKDAIEITIDYTTTTTANHKDISDKYDQYTIQVVNNKNSDIELPTTGGAGIYMFLIVGILLIGGASGLYITSRKKEKNSMK